MKRLLTDIDCCCCFIAFFSVIQAIPVKDSGAEGLTDNRTSLENVCVHENAIYKAGQNFSTGNPCETCVCDPPGVSCSLRSCDLKAGCKAIHKANRCCPEYVCECERNGKIYGNGEKVEEPNPCKVCYCKGGEIKCALVTCYTRDDCEPGYVAGVCCPKYDHCPPLEMNNNSTSTAPALVIVSDLKTESAIKMVPPVYLTTSTPYSSTAVTETTAFFEPTAEETETTEPELNATTEASTEFTTEDPTTEWTTESVTTELQEETTTTEESTTSTIAAEERKADVVEESTTTDVPETTPEYTTTIITEEPTTETAEEFNSTEVFTTEFTTTELITTTEGYAESTERTTTTTEPTTTTTTTTTPKSVIKVIIPKTMKKDLEQVQKSLDGPAPIVVMISAEQIQFLKLAEEPPVYVENRDPDEQKAEQDHLGVMVVPKTTPTTVEMVKVVEATLSSDANATTETTEPVHSSNSTDLTRER